MRAISRGSHSVGSFGGLGRVAVESEVGRMPGLAGDGLETFASHHRQ